MFPNIPYIFQKMVNWSRLLPGSTGPLLELCAPAKVCRLLRRRALCSGCQGFWGAGSAQSTSQQGMERPAGKKLRSLRCWCCCSWCWWCCFLCFRLPVGGQVHSTDPLWALCLALRCWVLCDKLQTISDRRWSWRPFLPAFQQSIAEQDMNRTELGEGTEMYRGSFAWWAWYVTGSKYRKQSDSNPEFRNDFRPASESNCKTSESWVHMCRQNLAAKAYGLPTIRRPPKTGRTVGHDMLSHAATVQACPNCRSHFFGQVIQ